MSKNQKIINYFKILSSKILPDKRTLDKINNVKQAIINAKKNNSKILIFGNGGSAAIASHVSVDFTKNLIKNIKYFPKDFQIDTFFYYLAKKRNFVIRRQKVNFNKKFRGYGEGNNDSFIKKIKGIFSHIFGTFNLIRIIFLKN